MATMRAYLLRGKDEGCAGPLPLSAFLLSRQVEGVR